MSKPGTPAPKGPVAAIINPASGGGRTGRDWPSIQRELETALGPVTPYFTDGPARPDYLPAAHLARAALDAGSTLLIAVGGDGTISETVNGIMQAGGTPDAVQLGLLNTGTGGDFRKSFDLAAERHACIARMATGTSRTVDIGRLSFESDEGISLTRYFNNIASFGLSGAVDRAINKTRFSKIFGGGFAYQWASFKALMRYKPQPVRIRTDQGFDEILNVSTAAIANGRFFGGGMMMAPNAKPDDGLFDLIIMKDMGVRDLASGSGSLYDGSHLQNEKVIEIRASWVEAEPINKTPVLLDIDGEAPGRLPARFDLLSSALTLRL
ncbi:MAG: diacylglycerol kinase family lipid kinase [Parvibaculum sp.]